MLELWTRATEGAKLWLQILTELRNRELQDIVMACVDDLKGFPDALGCAYPKTTVQLCIIHMVRNSLGYVNWKERKTVAQDLRAIYRTATAEQAEQRLAECEARWDAEYRWCHTTKLRADRRLTG